MEQTLLKRLLRWTMRNPVVRRRIFITVAVLLFMLVTPLIIVPGIDWKVLHQFIARASHGSGSWILFMRGGALSRYSVFALGIVPFITACVLIQGASILIPPLRKLSFGEEAGRRRIEKYSYVFSIAICLIQSFFVSLWLENPHAFHGIVLVPNPGWEFRTMCVLSMTAGTVILLFLANMINHHGIGNGFALIFVSSLPLHFVLLVSQLFTSVQRGVIQALELLPLGIFLVVFIFVVVKVTNYEEKIKIRGADSQNHEIILRPAFVGVVPASMGISALVLPLTLARFGLRFFYGANNWLASHALVQNFILIPLIVVFTFLYSWVVFDVGYIARLITRYGFSLEAGGSLEEFVNHVKLRMRKVLFITSAFLFAISVGPFLFQELINPQHFLFPKFANLDVVILIGVLADVFNHTNFFRLQRKNKEDSWSICYTAFDEVEANIKSAYLQDRGIKALIEPFRFTWGLPIRTVVDQYRIYVPIERVEEARECLSICP